MRRLMHAVQDNFISSSYTTTSDLQHGKILPSNQILQIAPHLPKREGALSRLNQPLCQALHPASEPLTSLAQPGSWGIEATTISCHAAGSPVNPDLCGLQDCILPQSEGSFKKRTEVSLISVQISVLEKPTQVIKNKLVSVHLQQPFQESNNNTLSSGQRLLNCIVYATYKLEPILFPAASTNLRFALSTSPRRCRTVCLLLQITQARVLQACLHPQVREVPFVQIKHFPVHRTSYFQS